MKPIFSKDIQMGIKKHWSVATFCEKFECTEDEFMRQVGRIYRNKDDIVKQIEQSAKKASKKKVTPLEIARKTVDVVEKTTIATTATTTTPAEIPVATPVTAPTSIEENTRQSDEDYLFQLRQSDNALREEIITLEVEHQSHRARRKTILSQIRKKKEEIDDLNDQLTKLTDSVEALESDYNFEASVMNELSAMRREKKKILAGITAKIADLSRPKLYVENDGSITFIRGTETAVCDDRAQATAAALFADERFDSCRVSALRHAARVITLMSTLPAEAEVDFADDEVGLIYLEYIGA